MALLSDYTAGTVTSSGTTITGTGTGWSAADFKEGDIFIAQGFWAIVSNVTSNTQLELVDWAGPALTSSAYRLRYMSDGSRSSAQARQLIDMLGGSGNIEALSGLSGLADMLPMFTGPGTMTLVPKTDLVSGADYDVQVDTLADRDAYDTQPDGFRVLVSDVGDGRSAIYSRIGGAGNWSAPAYVTGPVGPLPIVQAGTTTTGEPGTNADVTATPISGGVTLDFTIPAGQGFRNRGEYDNTTAYALGDVVTYDRSSYVAKQPTTGNLPTDTTYWDLLAAKGADGLGTVTSLANGNLISIDSTDPTVPVVGLAEIATSRILGRSDVGVGPVEVLTGDQVRGIATAARDTITVSTDSTDWNTITAPGFHPNLLGTTNANAPVSGQFFYCEVKRHTTDQNLIQIAYPYRNTGGGLWYRIRGTGTWGQWSQIGSDATGLLLSVGGAQAFDATQRAQGRANLGFPTMSAIRQVVAKTDNTTYTTTSTPAFSGNGGSPGNIAPSSDTSSLIVLCFAYFEVSGTPTSARFQSVLKYFSGSEYLPSALSVGATNGFTVGGATSSLYRTTLATAAFLTQAERRSDGARQWLPRVGFSLNAGTTVSNYSTLFICIEVDTVS